MDREKYTAGATRMVVEIDGRWDPKALFGHIQSVGLPIQGVKMIQHGRCTLLFGARLTRETLAMIQKDIVPFFTRSPEITNHKDEKWAPRPINKVRSFNHRHHHR